MVCLVQRNEHGAILSGECDWKTDSRTNACVCMCVCVMVQVCVCVGILQGLCEVVVHSRVL